MIHLPLLNFGACIPKGSPARFEACELVGERVAHLAGIQLADIRQMTHVSVRFTGRIAFLSDAMRVVFEFPKKQ